MTIEIGTLWKYNAEWARSLYEVLEVHHDGATMSITHNGRSDNAFCSFQFIENGLVQVSIDDITADHPIL